MKRSLSLLALVALFSSFASTPALAGAQIYPAGQCVPVWDSEVYVNGGRLFNPSSTRWAFVECPILHQHFGGSGDNLDAASIGIIDANTRSDVGVLADGPLSVRQRDRWGLYLPPQYRFRQCGAEHQLWWHYAQWWQLVLHILFHPARRQRPAVRAHLLLR